MSLVDIRSVNKENTKLFLSICGHSIQSTKSIQHKNRLENMYFLQIRSQPNTLKTKNTLILEMHSGLLFQYVIVNCSYYRILICAGVALT